MPLRPALSRLAVLGLLVAGLSCPPLDTAGARADTPVFPSSSRFGFQPPSDMAPSRRFMGFERLEGGAMVSVVELPGGAYGEIEKSFTDENLKSQGFVVESREAVKVSGGLEGVLLAGGQSPPPAPAADGANGTAPAMPDLPTVRKWLLLVNGPDVTGLVVAQMTPGAETDETMKGMLLGVTLRPPLTLDQQVDALPFRINDLAGFRPIRALAGNSLLMTRGPKDQPVNLEQPILVLAQAVQQPPTAEQREAFARAALYSNQTMKDFVIERSQSYRQNGVDWHEIVARANDVPTGQAVVITQTIRFAPDGYLRSLGVVRADQRDETLALFRQVVDSVQLR
ncbi:hypothetical protein [Methylobacterium gnaphalii]|uniref:Lipoprotein n=1 Tax=Methylobacterium gnaphalii TaxID=1010610 RepID=A0A512JE60_9HYPH|nr:hypothetical protein [Methylobacterium gnaphalii]GEP08236.1 hypothetical protein MGN01_00810 [Methylobacterium gnaphalii]GJD67988.1 hypothetical protein MMMDOFMJ_0906 [Methylobacterium gnaphalii]GLS51133.1 hypothetical protein GCM10007885_39870 [Methylobacterium gnaphalii]